MAVLSLNSKQMQLKVLVGVLETYIPDEEVKQIYQQVESLRLKTAEFLKSLLGEISTSEAMITLGKDVEKSDKWKSYITETYNTELKTLIENITKKNEMLCSNYKSVMGLDKQE